jgi:hypothetical protein
LNGFWPGIGLATIGHVSDSQPRGLWSATLTFSKKAVRTVLRGCEATIDRAFAPPDDGDHYQYPARRPLWLSDDNTE